MGYKVLERLLAGSVSQLLVSLTPYSEEIVRFKSFCQAKSEIESAGSQKAADEIRGVMEEIDYLPLLWRGRAGEVLIRLD